MMLNIGTTVVLGLLSTFAVGQVVTTGATCSPGYEWMFNSLSQSPCVVAASLAAPCWSGRFNLPAIPGPDNYYLGPTSESSTPCQCNSVYYSVLSACGYCQVQKYIKWSVYTYNCPFAYIYHQVYPYNIPTGLQVPSWAYMDVVTSDSFNVTLARLMSTSTTSSASTRPSLSYPSPSPILTPVLTTITPKSNSKKLIGGIVGGVVGGLIIIGGLVGFCLVRKHRRSKMSDLGSSPNGLMQQSLDSQAVTINFTGSSSNNVPPHFPGSPEV